MSYYHYPDKGNLHFLPIHYLKANIVQPVSDVKQRVTKLFNED